MFCFHFLYFNISARGGRGGFIRNMNILLGDPMIVHPVVKMRPHPAALALALASYKEVPTPPGFNAGVNPAMDQHPIQGE